MNIKRIIKEEMDDFDWARDVRTNQDIALDIVDKTKFFVLDGSLRVDPPFMSYYEGYPAKQLFKSSSLLKSKSPTIMFLNYVLKNYGFERTDYMAKYGINPNVGDIWFRYKNLITQKVLDNLKDKPINESDDFDWVRNIEIDTDLTPAQFYNRYEGNLPLKFVGPLIDRGFIDIDYDGDELYLKLENGWCDLKSLFTEHDTSSSQGAYINKSLVNNLYCDGDYFELFDGVVYDWEDQVWDLITQDDELYKYIIDHINENIVGYQMDFEGEQRTLTKEDIIEWSADSDVLGEAINDLDVFEDLKLELAWAYSGTYNTVVRDNIYKSVRKSVEDYLGPADWYGNVLTFKVTKPLLEYIGKEIDECWGECAQFWDPGEHEDTYMLNKTEEEGFEEYCHQCFDHPFDSYGYFLDFFEDYLSEAEELLNPSFDEFASDSEMLPYFKEEIYSRF